MPDYFVYDVEELATRPRAFGATIDSSSTKDIDDAVWAETIDGKIAVSVSIADVAYGILRGSEEDLIAYSRAFTVYFSDGNRSMLPKSYAEDRLSLVPQVDRPALTIDITLDEKFNILQSDVRRTILKSGRKWDHSSFTAAIDAGEEAPAFWYHIAQGLMHNRMRSGALFYYDPTSRVAIGEDGRPVLFKANEYKAQLLIQEFMILANRAAAEYAQRNNIPFLFRSHRGLAQAEFNRDLLLEKLTVADRDGDLSVIDEITRQIQGQIGRAQYGTTNSGHAGLSLPAYCHFTSPIRRYADLINHRQLVGHIEKKSPAYTARGLGAMAAHLNMKADASRVSLEARFREVAVSAAVAALRNVAPDEFRELQRTKPKGPQPDKGQVPLALRVLATHDAPDPAIEASMINLMAVEKITTTELFYIIVISPKNSHWQNLRNAALDYISGRSLVATALLREAIQKIPNRWTDLELIDNDGPDGFTCTIRVEVDGHPVTIEGPPRSRKAEARSVASVAFWNHLFDRADYAELLKSVVKVDETVPRGKNPVSILMELAQANGYTVEFSDVQYGPSHKPRFVGTVEVSGRKLAEPVVARGKESATRQQAKEMAAFTALVGFFGEERVNALINETQALAALTRGSAKPAGPAGSAKAHQILSFSLSEKHPVSIIGEWCVAKRLGLPRENSIREGPPHIPTFKVTFEFDIPDLSEPITVSAEGKSLKDARKSAATNLLRRMQEAGLVDLQE
jgi:ribonuclease R